MNSLIFAFALFASVAQAQVVDERFKQWDKNNDGKLSKNELPRFAQANFDRVDTDKDGSISPQEHRAFMQRMTRQLRPQQLPEGTIAHRNLAYVEDGHARQKLDLYLPAKATNSETARKLPLVIWIHGGGWQAGSKDRVRGLATLLEKDFAVASIGYRLSSDAIFPAQIHDCKAAVRFLRKHAAKHEIDPNRFGVWGASAGGHLVALLGTSGDVAELEGKLGATDVSSRVQAVCDWFGPTDLLKMNEQAGDKGRIDHNANNSPESKLLGGPLQKMPGAARTANPITYASPDDPPFLIMHGDRDPLVPHQQSEMLDAKLDEAKVDSDLEIITGAGHGFSDSKYIDRVAAFFQQKLASKSNN